MFRNFARMRQKKQATPDASPHLAHKTALFRPFHRDFAPPNINSSVGMNIAYYIGMSGTQTKTEGGEMTSYTVSAGEATVTVRSDSAEQAATLAWGDLQSILAQHSDETPVDMTVTDDATGQSKTFAA